ncbi:hypothetical protein ABIE87_004937 [Bradyrhizobium diazoefficiens]|uniref:hypothetical protein n=1 Tax=Bradyrhizobium diazoefficiens TaxID=1355477 RepID=UPI0035133D3B
MKLEDFIKFVAEHDCIPVKRDTNFIARILFESLGSCAEFSLRRPASSDAV